MSMFNSLTNDFNEIFNFAMAKQNNVTLEYDENEARLIMQVPGHNSSTLDVNTTAEAVQIRSLDEIKQKYASTIDQSFRFSPNIYDGSAISAVCKDGLLFVTVPIRKNKIGNKVKIG